MHGQTADDVYENYVVRGKSGLNAARIQSSELTGNYYISRAALVCLVLLCFLLLTAVIVLSVFIYTNNTNYTQERCQLLTNITKLTEDRKELLTRNNNLTEERNQLLTTITNLTEKRRQLLIQNENLINEREQLIFQNDNLTKERDQWKSVRFNLDGWTYYQNSLYFISTETKKWGESRQDCLDRKADLVTINSNVEQDFVKDISAGANVWTALSDIEVEGAWKWTDGTKLKNGFSSWASGEPNSRWGVNEDCVLTSPNGWNDFPCDYYVKYLCEKNIFK